MAFAVLAAERRLGGSYEVDPGESVDDHWHQVAAVAASAALSAQSKTIPGDVVTITATVEAIDATTRTLTVKGSDGTFKPITVSRSMERF